MWYGNGKQGAGEYKMTCKTPGRKIRSKGKGRGLGKGGGSGPIGKPYKAK